MISYLSLVRYIRYIIVVNTKCMSYVFITRQDYLKITIANL
jgi:hypothetical protein